MSAPSWDQQHAFISCKLCHHQTIGRERLMQAAAAHVGAACIYSVSVDIVATHIVEADTAETDIIATTDA